MISPNASQITAALDTMKDVKEFIHTSQLKELHSAVGETTKDFQKGYELGLQTARRVILGSIAVQMKGINPNDIL